MDTENIHVDTVESWDSLMRSLIEHGTVSTMCSGYDNHEAFLRHLSRAVRNNSSFEDYYQRKVEIVGLDNRRKDSSGRPYLIVKMFDNAITNEEAKFLLEEDY